jgi:hypothetical protein
MTDLLDFKNFRATVKELERLLDYVFIGAGLLRSANDTVFIKRKEPISSWIEQLLHADRIGDSKSKAYLLSKIAILILDLQCIEESRPELLAHFQRKFRKHTENEFWGLRFEVDIASTLAKKEILFTPGDRLPGGESAHGDFVCGEASIECTSIHASKIKRFNSYAEKIQRAVRRKKNKTYCANNVALFLDITNICFERGFVGDPIGDEELRSVLKDELTCCDYGAIVASLWFFNEDGQLQSARYQNLFVREDSGQISASLRLLLDNDLGLNQVLPPLTKVTWTSDY